MTNTINWSIILDEMSTNELRDFASGNISGRQFYESAFYGVSQEARSQVRSLLRVRGVTEARALARKALRRRGVSV
jgi:hypothetical protein